MTALELDQAVADHVARSRARQGLPATVESPTALAGIVRAITRGREEAPPSSGTSSATKATPQPRNGRERHGRG